MDNRHPGSTPEYPLPTRTPMEALAAYGQSPPDPATDRMYYASPGPAPWSGPAKRKRPVLAWVAAGLAALAVLCGSVALIGSLGTDPVAPVVSTQPTTNPMTAEPTTKVPAAAVPVTIEDGLYEVGPDIKPGTYRLSAPVAAGDFCYWSKSRDAEGEDIIDNDLAGVGRLQVTLKKGQWFKTSRCGTWTRR